MTLSESLRDAPFGWTTRCEVDLPTGTDWLSSWEAARLDRMRFRKRRDEYLTSRLTAKHAMAATLGVDPHPLARFEVRHHLTGAPFPHLELSPAPLSVSMTDRAGWAITVTSPVAGVRLGVDLELVEPRSPAFVRDWFTPAEQDLVAAARDDEDVMVRANLIWSAKESALKVLQTGLRRDTRTVEVELDTAGERDAWQPLTVTAVEGDVMPGWWRRYGQFLLTVAAESDVAVPTGLEPDADDRLSGATPIHSWLQSPTVAVDPTAVPDGHHHAGPARAPQAGRSAQ